MTRTQSKFLPPARNIRNAGEGGIPRIDGQAKRRKPRANTSKRGYGAEHQKLRRAFKPRVDTGRVRCWRCGDLITPDPTIPGEGWDLGHDDDDRRIYRGPEHVECNRATSSRRRWNSREW